MNKTKAYEIFHLLKEHYPHAKMILQWGNNFELLVAIILSAQCTDKKVNEVTSVVFPKYREEREELIKKYEEYEVMPGVASMGVPQRAPAAIAKPSAGGIARQDPGEKNDKIVQKDTLRSQWDPHVAHAPQDDNLKKDQLVEIVNFAFVPLAELEQDIKPTGFYHNKAKSVQGAAKTVLETFGGKLPRTITELTRIPGVGRKTANVFLGNAYGISEGIAVDTHVTKQAQAFGFTKQKTPEKIEQDLMQLFDQKDWFALTYLLIEHGRNMRKKKSDRHTCSDSMCILCHSEK